MILLRGCTSYSVILLSTYASKAHSHMTRLISIFRALAPAIGSRCEILDKAWHGLTSQVTSPQSIPPHPA